MVYSFTCLTAEIFINDSICIVCVDTLTHKTSNRRPRLRRVGFCVCFIIHKTFQKLCSKTTRQHSVEVFFKWNKTTDKRNFSGNSSLSKPWTDWLTTDNTGRLSSSAGRVCIPSIEARLSVQWPRARVRPAALSCMSHFLSSLKLSYQINKRNIYTVNARLSLSTH